MAIAIDLTPLDILPDRTREILLLRSGLGVPAYGPAGKRQTLRECADALDLSPQRIRELQRRGLRTLKYQPGAHDVYVALLERIYQAV